MDAIQNYLYLLSNALLLPTLLSILALSAWTIFMVGGILREWSTRGNICRTWTETRKALKRGDKGGNDALRWLRACSSGVPARFTKRMGEWSEDLQECEKCLEDMESDIATSLSKLSWATRVAPMLGLMGTLIPLGPALTGLASGNIAMLSGNLVVAFTATVIGVLIGCAAYTMGIIRRNWYGRDMSELEYLVTRLTEISRAHETKKKKVG